MTYDELRSKLNDLPYTRHRAVLVDEIHSAGVEAGFENIADYIEKMVRDHLLRPAAPATLPLLGNDTLRGEATAMIESEWAKDGYPGAKNPEDMARFLGKHGGLWERSYDELSEGEQRLWRVASALHKSYRDKRG